MELRNIQYIDSNTRTVYIDVEFTKIGDIDTLNEKYYIDLSFILSWEENGTIKNYDKNIHWNPEIFVDNLFSKSEDTVEYELFQHDSVTHVVEKRRLKGYLWERIEINNFPHDVQELSVTFGSKLDSNHVKMVGKHFSLGTLNKHALIQQQKWELLDLVECVSLASYDSDKNLLEVPKLRFKCYACRRPFYYYANAYFLIFLVTMTSLCVFSIDCSTPQNRLQTTETILLILVLLKWVISRSLPQISYTTSLDLYSIISMIFVCLLMVWHSIIGAASKNSTIGAILLNSNITNFPQNAIMNAVSQNSIAYRVDKWMILVFSLMFISFNLFFIIMGIKKYLYVCGIEKRRMKKGEKSEVVGLKNKKPNRCAKKV